jgi:predicted oxidoreductase
MATLHLPAAPRPFGRSKLTVSPLAWGMWRFRGTDTPAAARLVHAALDTGLTLLDTADIYGPDNGEPFGAAEALLGEVVAREPALRGRMVLASKGGIALGVPYNSSAAYLIEACEASLRRLRTDHIDLYQIHRPDTLAHPAEVAGALEKLRRDGKILEAGVSNYSAAQARALAAHLTFPLTSTQPEFSALAIAPLTDGVLDHAQEAGLGVLAWSPLGGGRLGLGGAGKREQDVIAALDAIAVRETTSRTAVAYAWIMAHPSGAIPIVGSQSEARIREATEALRVKLTRTDWYDILTASRQERLP